MFPVLQFMFLLLGFTANNLASASGYSSGVKTESVPVPVATSPRKPDTDSTKLGHDEDILSDAVDDLMDLDLGPMSPLSDAFDTSLLSIIEDLEKPVSESGAAVVLSSETEESRPVSSSPGVGPAVDDKTDEISEIPSSQTVHAKIDKIPTVTSALRPRRNKTSTPRSESDSVERRSPSPVAPKRFLLESNNQIAVVDVNEERRGIPWLKVVDFEYAVYSLEKKPLNSVVKLSQLKSDPRDILPPFQFIKPFTRKLSFVEIPLLEVAQQSKIPNYPHTYAILRPLGPIFAPTPPLPVPIVKAYQPVEPVQVHPIPIPITTSTTAVQDKPMSRPRNSIQKRSITPGVIWNPWQPRAGPILPFRRPDYTMIRSEQIQSFPRPPSPYRIPPQAQPRPIEPYMPPSPYVRQTLIPKSTYPQQSRLSNFNHAPQGGPRHNEPWITSFQPNPQFQRGINDNSPPAPKYAQGIGYWPQTGFRQTFEPPSQRQGPSPTFRSSTPTQHQGQVQLGFKKPAPWSNRPASPISRYSPYPQIFIPFQQQQPYPPNHYNLQSSPRGPSPNYIQYPVQGGRTFNPSTAASPPSESIPGQGHGEPPNTLVNPFTYFRSHGPVSNAPASYPQQQVSQTDVNPNPTFGAPTTHASVNNGTNRPQPLVKTHAPAGSQPQSPTTNQGPQTTTVPILPESRRPVPFYSQADVDSHYRRMLAHNETKKDKEFENDNELLQWNIQRAKQILRQRNSQANDTSKSSQQSPSAEPTQGVRDGSDGRHQQEQPSPAAPRPVPDTYTSSLGSNSYSGPPRTNSFPNFDSGPGRQGYGNDTGYVFNGTSIHPNGGIVRVSNEHDGRHSLPRRHT